MKADIDNLHPFDGRRLHVLEVLGNAIVGGMESYVMRLVERLPRDRFAVTCVCPAESRVTERLRRAGAEIVVTPMPHDEAPWLSVQMVCALVRSRGVDVLHAHLPNAHLLAGLAGALSDRPVVSTIHGRQVTPLDIEVHRAAGTHVSVVCKHSYFHALGMGIAEAQLDCIPNGVDTHLFDPDGGSPDTRQALRGAFGVEGDAPLFGFVGRLSPEKGPELFLQALSGLFGMVPEARGVIVGDGPMRADLEALASRLSLDERIAFAGIRDDMPDVYRALDVMVSSSHSEAMPLAIMEAMASGLPVVATRVGGVPELIEQAGTGYGVGARDVDGLAGQMALLAGDAAAREVMGARARQRAVAHFALDQCVDRTIDMLARVAARTPARIDDGRGSSLRIAGHGHATIA